MLFTHEPTHVTNPRAARTSTSARLSLESHETKSPFQPRIAQGTMFDTIGSVDDARNTNSLEHVTIATILVKFQHKLPLIQDQITFTQSATQQLTRNSTFNERS